jgi:hypothetical protein
MPCVSLEGVDYIDIVLCPSSFFAQFLNVFIVVENKWNVEVRANLCVHSRFHLPNAAMTCVYILTFACYVSCEILNGAHILNVFLYLAKPVEM